MSVWGEAGVTVMPSRSSTDEVAALAVAAQELAASVEAGRPHPLDVRLGARFVEILAEAEAQVRSRH